MKLLHADAGPRARLFFTRYVFALWVLRFVFYSYAGLATLPRDYYAPVGVLRWTPWLNDLLFVPGAMTAMRLAAALAAAMCCLRPRSLRVWGTLACVLLTIEQSLVRGFSVHINHSEVNLLLAAYVLTAFAWADGSRQSHDDSRRSGVPQSAPLVTCALTFCLTYYFVGVSRLVYGGWEIYLDNTMINNVVVYAHQPWFVDFRLGLAVVQYPPAAFALKAGYAAITLFEILAPLALLWRPFRWLFLLVMAGFHVSNVLLMKIAFFENMALLILLIDLAYWLKEPAQASKA